MSFRTRLFLSYLLLVILCLGVSAISVSVLLQHYRDQIVLIRLDDMTRPISNQIKELLRGQTTLAQAWTNIQQLAADNNTYILFVDDKGNLLREASPGGSSNPLSVPEGLPHGISQPAHGIFTAASGKEYVYSAYPLSRAGETLIPRPQTIILSQPRSNLAFVVSGLINPFFWSGIIALIISLVMAFFLARSVSRPIQALSKVAGNIAQGRYDEKVTPTGPAEIKALATDFNEMAEKLKDSQQQMRHFVADVSHQLRSPLTSIQGFAQAMLDGTASDEETRQKAARIIEDESKRMIRQVNELLELSRMQAGQVKMAKEPVSIRDLLLHCQEIFALRLEEKKITLKNEMEYSGFVNGDADRLEDVFNNLLDNAIKNTPQYGEIKVITRPDEHQSLNITIADSGPGIPPEQIPFVFDRFQSSSGLRSGFGLGLAIAREIVINHGGQITVASNPGEGTRFTVVLPLS
jgi:two-component system, OmpR family, sensor kinase